MAETQDPRHATPAVDSEKVRPGRSRYVVELPSIDVDVAHVGRQLIAGGVAAVGTGVMVVGGPLAPLGAALTYVGVQQFRTNARYNGYVEEEAEATAETTPAAES
jgi:hypothetical protein